MQGCSCCTAMDYSSNVISDPNMHNYMALVESVTGSTCKAYQHKGTTCELFIDAG